MNTLTKHYEKYRQQLLKLREETAALMEMGENAARPVELDQTKVGRVSRMDAMQAQAMSLETQRRRELQLTKITNALQRIADEDFGYCVRCEEAISLKRLDFDPTSLLCIACATDAEA